MKDVIGQDVKNGDLIYMSIGSGRDISQGFAIVVDAEKARIRIVVSKEDRVYDEPGFDWNGNPDDNGYYNSQKERRAYHWENFRYEYGYSGWNSNQQYTTLKKKFTRAIVVNPADVKIPELYDFLMNEGFISE